MPPISLGTSHSKLALETGQAKLWILLIGVNDYQDLNLPRLSYPALDCQGLSDSLLEATQAFPQKNIIIHHDFAPQKPLLETVKTSLETIVTSAKTQDTILFYFSGHGLLETQSQETVLCVADTQTDNLLKTGLILQELLQRLSQCSAHCQVIWLDACHCGNMTLRGAKGCTEEPSWDDPTSQLLATLRQKAAKSKGFYALLSCDQGQKSWEFPDLGHGVFSYFLMRGLRGEAADGKGVIKADELYQYVYNQTLNYIDKINQQLRLINQQRRCRGESHLYSEYSLQTPKRIVEGVGELILGLKSPSPLPRDRRYALIVQGCPENQTLKALGEVLTTDGQFSVTVLCPVGKEALAVRQEIQAFLQRRSPLDPNHDPLSPSDTILLYLRGQLEVSATGDSDWVLENGIKLSRSWLRQELRRCHLAQQIIILDGYGTGLLEEWIEELQLGLDQGQCLLAALNPQGEPDLFAQILLDSLVAANPQVGLSGAQWLSLLQKNCEQLCLPFSAWLSGIQGVIDILPGKHQETLFPLHPPSRVLNPSSATLQQEQTAVTPSPSHPLTLSPEQYANLSAFLTQLIGPVAVPLLQSALEETTSIKELWQTLAQYLTPTQKPQFDQWAIAMFKEEKKIDSPSVPPSPRPPLSPSPPLPLSPEQYSQLASVLKAIIGPIAPTLLDQMAEPDQPPEGLIARLKEYLTPLERTEFEQQLVSVFANNDTPKLTVISEPVPPSELTSGGLDDPFIQQCEQALTQLIGPVAHFIMETTLEDRPGITRTELIEAIASRISDPQESANFRQHFFS